MMLEKDIVSRGAKAGRQEKEVAQSGTPVVEYGLNKGSVLGGVVGAEL